MNNLYISEEDIIKDSSEIYVSTTGSDENGEGSENNPYKSINYAVEKSSDDSIIYLSQGTYAGEKNRDITIEKNLTISSASNKEVILDAESTSRFFTITPGNKLTLIGLTLINGYSNETGGSIYNNQSEITLIDSRIENSSAEHGGAIGSLGTLNIINSTLNKNNATQYGGAIFSFGNLNIENSNLTNNMVTIGNQQGIGGCIITNGTTYLNNCLFDKNYASYSSGAMFCDGKAYVNNCTFINQTTNYTAGAISNHDFILINNSYFLECYALYYAAVILNPPAEKVIRIEAYNTVFEKNHADRHAAVTNNYFETGELVMYNCAIVENYLIKGSSYGDITVDTNATALYCWWGQNEISPYYYSPHNNEPHPELINASKWLVMNFTSSNEIIKQDQNNILTVSLKCVYDNDTKQYYDYDGDINLPLTVRIYEGNGDTIGYYKLENGTVSINYTPKDDTKAVFAKLNNQIIRIPVKQRIGTDIIAEDLTKYYSSTNSFKAQLKDVNNANLFNKTIVLIIGNSKYTGTTDKNGNVKFALNLKPGTYSATVKFLGDDDYNKYSKVVSINILKNKTSISAKNLVKYYKNGTKLSVKLLDNNKNPLKSKTVKIKIAGKTYSKTTNGKGIATFAINQKVGTYSVKISFNGDAIYQKSSKTIKIYVKSAKLTTKTKRIHKGSYFVATLKDKNGKAIKKTKIKFRLNGKTFTKTTNYKGIAKLKIKVKIGSYKIKTSFKSTKIYGATVFTNKIKVIR